MEITGRAKAVFETQVVSAKFSKRELVLVTKEQYPQEIILEFQQDKTTLLDNVNVGEDYTVSVNLRGREWINTEGIAKYFNTIVGWKIQAAEVN